MENQEEKTRRYLSLRDGNPQNLVLSLYGQRIDCVEYVNCLGVTLDRRLYMTGPSGTYVRFAVSLFLSA
jgi:hypothetical protein